MAAKTNLTYRPNPLTPSQSAKKIDLIVVGEVPVIDVLKEAGLDRGGLDYHILVNGKPVSRGDWHTVKVTHADKVDVCQFARGGDGSDPVRIIAQIAVVALAIFAPQLAGIAYGTWKASALQAGILLAGNLVIAAVFPPVVPGVGDRDDVPPSFSIAGSRNRARVGQPLPLVVGRHKIAPDLGTRPFTSQNSEDAFLEQIFNFGYGDLEITDIKIGETPIDNFENIQTQFSDANDEITLVPGDVVSTTGGALEPGAGFTERTSAADVTRLVVDLNGTLFATSSEGDFLQDTVVIQIEYKPTSSSTWLPFFDVSNSGQRFAVQADAEGVAGNFGFSNVQLRNSSPQTLRRTFEREVPKGEYDVRLRRVTPDRNDNRRTAQIVWSQLRSYQVDNGDYEAQTRYAVRVQASGQLNGTIDSLNAIASAKIPVFDTGSNTFITQESSNPAWIFYYIAKGQRAANGRRLFGLGYTDAQIDLDKIKEWAEWCDDNQLECNYVFQNDLTTMDMLALVARTGRATPTFQTGRLGVVYDRDSLPIVQRFGMSNIIENTFEVSYISERLADEIIVEFVNEDAQWVRDEVSVTVNDGSSSTPSRPARLFLQGVTTQAQAAKEANLIAARQFYHTKRISFETDLEGFIVNRGDVIAVSHDMTNYGSSGNVVSGNNNSLVLDRDVTFEVGNTYHISVRTPEGDFNTVEVVNPSTIVDTETNLLTLADPLPYVIDADPDHEPYDYLWFFDFKETPGEKFKVISVEPTNEDRIRLTAIPEVDAYYDSESGPVVYVPPTFPRAGVPSVENVTVSEIFNGANEPIEINVRWDLDNNAQGARVRYRLNDGDWVNLGTINGVSTRFLLTNWEDDDTLFVEVSPVSLVNLIDSNAADIIEYTIRGVPELSERVGIPDVRGLELFEGGNTNVFGGRDAKFVWLKARSTFDPLTGQPVGLESAGIDPFFKDYQVTIRNTNGTVRRVEFVKDEAYIYSFEKNAEDDPINGAAREFRIEVVYRSTFGINSQNPASLGVSNPAPATPTGVTAAAGFSQLFVTSDRPNDLDFQGTIVHLEETTSDFTPTPLNRVYIGPELSPTINTFAFSANTDYRIKVAHFDGFGESGLNFSGPITVDLNDTAAGIPKGTTLPNVADAEVGDIFILLDDPAPGESTMYRLYAGTPNFWDKAIKSVDIAEILESNLIPNLEELNGLIESGQIGPDAVGTTEIADDAISTPKLQANSVTANEILSNSITANEIAAGTITANEIASNTITGNEIAANTITSNEILANTITSAEIAADSIGANEINFNTAFGEELFASQAFINALATEQLDLGPIIFDDANNARVDSNLTLSGSGIIRAGKTSFADNVNGGFIFDFNAGNPRFKVGSSATQQIAWNGSSLTIRGSLNADDITAGTIDTSFINIDGISLTNNGGTLEIGTVNTGDIANGAVGNAQLANLAVSGAKIQNATIGAAQIANGAITNAKIGNLQVDSAKIADLTVDTIKVANGAITNTVTSSVGSSSVDTTRATPYTDFTLTSATLNGILASSTVVITASFDVTVVGSIGNNSFIQYSIFRGSTELWRSRVIQTGIGTVTAPRSVTVTDTTSGNQTYSMRVSVTGGNAFSSFYNINTIVAQEIKK
jgi:sulfur carrier protein ThiS